MKVILQYANGNDVENKVGAIKSVRQATGMGLKESKELIESLPTEISINGNTSDIKRFKNDIAGHGVRVVFSAITVGTIHGWINTAINAHEFELAELLITFLRERDDSPEPVEVDGPISPKEDHAQIQN